MARVIVRDLIESPDVKEIAICGRSLQKARAFADELSDSRAIPVQVDINDQERLGRTISDFDVVINSAWYEYNFDVMKEAINQSVSYVDLGGLYHMTLKQLKLSEEAKDAGITCLLGMGSTPGTMNVMAAYAAKDYDSIEKIRLRSGYKTISKETNVFQVPYSLRTVIDEFTQPAPILRNGKISTIPPISRKKKFILPKPVGEVEGYITIHSELATLPMNLDKMIKEMDFIVAYDPEFTQTVTTIVKLGLSEKKEITIGEKKISPLEVLSTLVDSFPKQEEQDVDVQLVEVEGKKENENIQRQVYSITFPHKRWHLGGGTIDTGVPPSIAAQWIATGKIKAKGVVAPEQCIDPLPYFKELNLRGRGIKIYEIYESYKSLN